MLQDMRRIFEKMNNPIWIMDKDNKVIFLNGSFKSCFNIDNTLDLDMVLEYMEKEDEYKLLLENFKGWKDNSKDIFIFKEKIYKYEVSPIKENNEELYVGTILEVFGIEKSNEYMMLKTIIDNVPSLIFYKDENLRYVGLNKACEEFYKAKGVSEIIGKNDLELPLEREFVETCYEHDKIVLASKETLHIEEKVFIDENQGYKIFQTIKTPVFNKNNKVVGLVGVVRDMTEYKLEAERLTYLSYTDSLTGLYNRFYFYKKIEELKAEEEQSIGIIFGDVNGLKLVNDILGHNDGDKFLIEIANCLKQCCDGVGIPVRWSGDEFCIIISKASPELCRELIDAIKKEFSGKLYKNFNLTIALGHSIMNKNDNIDNVLANAEVEAYKQKTLSSKAISISTIESLNQSLQKKNLETKEHTERVAQYCERVGRIMNLNEESIEKLVLVGRLHDIGKIGISEELLLKPGRLDEDELEIMKTHTEKGYRMALILPELSYVAREILTHHERWDGTGYPLGLKGEEIPLISRIVAVVDAYDAMINRRSYRKVMTFEEAVLELKSCAGKQFDPRVVEIFCNIVEVER